MVSYHGLSTYTIPHFCFYILTYILTYRRLTRLKHLKVIRKCHYVTVSNYNDRKSPFNTMKGLKYVHNNVCTWVKLELFTHRSCTLLSFSTRKTIVHCLWLVTLDRSISLDELYIQMVCVTYIHILPVLRFICKRL